MALFRKIFRRIKELPPATTPVHYPYLVTGCGRSGTHFLAKYLQLNGLDIGHEKPEQQGVVGWIYAADGFCKDRLTTFDHRGHIIRHPQTMLRSVQTINPRAWRYIFRYLPACEHPDKAVAGARYWLHWNRLAMQGAAFSVRLEDFNEETAEVPLQKLEAFFGRRFDPALIPAAREHGDSRKKRGDYAHNLSLADIARKDPETYAGIEALAAEFDYRIELP